jgi:UDP-4-amino-4,6-dideoxy-N-acetyl-beta-L-altrosamine N-acetyltransferase
MAVDVKLRDMREEDRDRLLAWRNLPDIRRWMYSDHLITPEEHARWFPKALKDRIRHFWIVELDGGPVGLANLYDIAPAHGRAAWAYYLAAPEARGRGIGAFVEYSVIEQAFGPFGLTKLWCEILSDNSGVIRLHQRFGFEREALFRQHIRKGGETVDVVGMGLLAADWAQLRTPMGDGLRARGFPL